MEIVRSPLGRLDKIRVFGDRYGDLRASKPGVFAMAVMEPPMPREVELLMDLHIQHAEGLITSEDLENRFGEHMVASHMPGLSKRLRDQGQGPPGPLS